MATGVRFIGSRTIFLLTAITGCIIVREVTADKVLIEDGKLIPLSYRSITGHLGVLRHYRRHLTLVASTALGAFIVRVMKESPLTPLAMPPVQDPARWNFLLLPLHASYPYLRRMQMLYQNLEPSTPPWNMNSENFLGAMDWKGQTSYRRDVTKR